MDNTPLSKIAPFTNMKTRFSALLCLILASAVPVSAAKGGKAAGKAAATAEKALPSAQLHRVIDTTLPKINSLVPKNGAINRTALIEVQVDYVAKAQVATPADQPMYQAAAAVMHTLIAAVDEHDKAVANFRYSKSVHGPQDTKDSELTNAVGNGRANNAKQNKENADSRRELLAKEDFMNKGVIDTWTTRAAQLRASVEQAYATEFVIEKKTIAVRSATVAAVTPPAPPKPKPVKKESSAAEQYSPVGSWPGDKLPWVFKEDGVFQHGSGGGEWKWQNQSKGELELKWKSGKSTKGTFSADGHTLEVAGPAGRPETLKR